METNSSERNRAWSSYWKGGVLHSCAGSYAENYDGVIGRFWHERFAGLEAGSRVLDLATGNGALPKLLADFVAGRWSLLVDAVDIAELAPGWHVADVQPGINFHSGVRMEELPFPDRQYDLVVSQFGLEYAQWPNALDEAMRVLRPGGRLAFVIHHASSVLVKVGRIELLNQRLLLEEGGVLEAAAAALPWIHKARAGDPSALGHAAQQARVRYNLAMQRVGNAITGSEAPDLLLQVRDSVHGFLAGRFGQGLAEQLQQLELLRVALQGAMLRTKEMIACARAVDDMQAMQGLLRQRMPSSIVECLPLEQDGHVLGWGVAVATTA